MTTDEKRAALVEAAIAWHDGSGTEDALVAAIAAVAPSRAQDVIDEESFGDITLRLEKVAGSRMRVTLNSEVLHDHDWMPKASARSYYAGACAALSHAVFGEGWASISECVEAALREHSGSCLDNDTELLAVRDAVVRAASREEP